MARPRLNIDPEQVKRLALIHCTMEEIASIVGCSVDTLERRFADVIKDARANGRMSIKRKQFEQALNGNTTMLIWLGKQYLDQSDKNEERHDVQINQPTISEGQTVALIERALNLGPGETND